jgi:hypothetical protein
MFETPKPTEKPSHAGMWIGVTLVVVVSCVGGFMFVNSQGPKGAASGTASAAGPAAPAQTKADAVHDLRIVSARMDKDASGTTAVWAVDIKNQSAVFTYSDITYETTYAGGDNSVLLQNRGKISVSLGPGDEEIETIRDALYPSGTAWYKFRVESATAAK